LKEKGPPAGILEGVDPTGYLVEIAAAGYKLLRKPLSSCVGPTRKLFDPPNVVVVDLQPKGSQRGSR